MTADVGPGAKELISDLTGGAGKTERGDSLAGGSAIGVLEPNCGQNSIRGKVVGLCNIVNVGGRGGVKSLSHGTNLMIRLWPWGLIMAESLKRMVRERRSVDAYFLKCVAESGESNLIRRALHLR